MLANLRLVVKIAMEYRRAWTNLLDLIQEGNVGLLQAVQRFDPYQGVKLSSYAAYWIRAYILKYLIDNIRLVRLGSTRAERKLFFRLNKEKRELERQGFEAEPKLHRRAPRRDRGRRARDGAAARASDLSIDAPVGDEEGGARFGDFVAAPGDSVEQQVADEELRATFMSHVKAFADRLEAARAAHHARRASWRRSRSRCRSSATRSGLTRERIRQLEKRLVDDLRDYLQREGRRLRLLFAE